MTDDRDPERTHVALTDPVLGKVLGRRYRVEQRLAAGGFGAVYRARELVEGREVAIKVVHPVHATDRGVAARFRREAAALRRLNHRHTVKMYELGEEPDGTLYIAMELLSGDNLWEQFQAHGPLPWRRVLKIVRMVCSALAQAHALDIVHRDLKPENIHLELDGGDPDFVKVVDFGIAKILRGSRDETAELTHGGQIIGTFDYMAPEQMVGGECTPASDIFTVGIVMYEMICGERPFGSPKTTAAMLNAILKERPVPLSARAGTPPMLDPIVARCLARAPASRYAYADELGADLERVLAAVPPELPAAAAPDLDEEKTQTLLRPPTFAFEGPTFAAEGPTFASETATVPLDDGSEPGGGATLPGLPPRRRR